jgi:hypothetical protein
VEEKDECMNCGMDWKWNTSTVFDFNKPVGKRVWPAICFVCRADIETKYKTGKITKTELMMEFITISGRIAKKCAITPGNALRALEQMKSFAPKRRGK